MRRIVIIVLLFVAVLLSATAGVAYGRASTAGCSKPRDHVDTVDSTYYELACAKGAIPIVTVAP